MSDIKNTFTITTHVRRRFNATIRNDKIKLFDRMKLSRKFGRCIRTKKSRLRVPERVFNAVRRHLEYV
jgi:hypothetical protein